MLDFRKIMDDAVRTAKEKGWLDTERSFATITNLFHSEPSEALEDFRVHHGLNETYYEVSYGYMLGGVQTVGTQAMSYDELQTFRSHEGVTVNSAKPCGIPIEMADVIIRIAQECGTRGWPLVESLDFVKLNDDPILADFNEALARIHLAISKSFQASITAGELPPVQYLAGAVKITLAFCEKNGIDIGAAIAIKQAYNDTRKYRHGGKAV